MIYRIPFDKITGEAKQFMQSPEETTRLWDERSRLEARHKVILRELEDKFNQLFDVNMLEEVDQLFDDVQGVVQAIQVAQTKGSSAVQ